MSDISSVDENSENDSDDQNDDNLTAFIRDRINYNNKSAQKSKKWHCSLPV